MEEINPLLESEDMIDAIFTIRDFRSDKINFHDWWEFDNKRYTYNFLWCCYALVWAIEQYDASHAFQQLHTVDAESTRR